MQDGWIKAEKSKGREYFLYGEGANEKATGYAALYHQYEGTVVPTWELFIQLADYARLRFFSELLGLQVRLEEEQMDITVWNEDDLVLYIENKEKTAVAKRLVQKMIEHGELGFDLQKVKGDKDAVIKARYLFKTSGRPQFIAVSTLDYDALYVVEYLGGNNRFKLTETPGGITAPLVDSSLVNTKRLANPAAALAIEIERQLQNHNLADRRRTWFSRGSRDTEFNFYVYSPFVRKHALVMGAYQSGLAWSELKSLCPAVVSRLSDNLDALGISFNADKDEATWRTANGKFQLSGDDVGPVASAVIDAVIPGAGGMDRDL